MNTARMKTQEGQDGLFALDLTLLQQKSDTSVK
jgi:hypothetical protein